MKLKFDVENYEYDDVTRRTIQIEGKSVRSCLLQAFDCLDIRDDAEDVLAYEKKRGEKLNDKKLLNRLVNQSTDQSDYVLSITDLDTGKVLYDSGDDRDIDEEEYSSEYDDE